MPGRIIDYRAESAPQGIIQRAAELLKAGALVVLPTETVYGVAAAASDAAAFERLWEAKGSGHRAPLAWHLPSSVEGLDALKVLIPRPSALHRRLFRVLTPGPVTIAIPAPAERLADLRLRHGVAPGVFDDDREVLLRIPDRAVTREVIRQAGVPVVIGALGESALARTAADAEAALRATGSTEHVQLILGDGPTDFASLSTLIRLIPAGSFEIVREGAIDERTIRRRLVRTLLFVCTGNTCRSPMAAAIARHLLAQNPPDGVETRIRSAGVSAGFGAAATPEAVQALRERGIEMGRHASTPLTREMLNEAEAIFTMTRSHADAVIRIEPAAGPRVQLLDPLGQDIPDPIGSPQDAYDRTAEHLIGAVRKRLEELSD